MPDLSVVQSDSAQDRRAMRSSVTLRAVVLGTLLLPVNAYWVIQMERVRDSAHPTTVSLFFNCIFILVVLTGINGFIARLFKGRFAFTQGELLLVYSMLCIGSCLAAVDLTQVLVPHITWPYSEATTSNGYASLFQRYLPRWAMVTDVNAVRGFWAGHDTLYTRRHLQAWIGPTLVWTAFMTVLLFVMQCINSIIRKQWSDHEHLTYPLTKIPLEITDGMPGGRSNGLGLTRNKLFWIGFLIAMTIDTNNSLNYYFPSIPPILTPGNGQSMTDLSLFVLDKPWNAIGWTPMTFYPFIIGLGVLMPMDFLFSSWFFYIFWKLQFVVTAAQGWDADPLMPYANYQAFGAYAMFMVSSVTLSRHYLKDVLNKVLGRPSDLDDSAEPMSYRASVLGIIAGLAILTAITTAMGLAPWLGAITRMRAELGTPVHDLHFTGPNYVLTDLLGSRALGPQNLTVFGVLFWFNRAYRAHPMPHQMEGFRLAEQTNGGRELRKWFWVMLYAGAFGMICGIWAMLHCYYHYGGMAKVAFTLGPEAWDRLSSQIKQPKAGLPQVGLAIGGGFLFAAFLQAMRIRFSWWPFHPLAYAVSGSWEMNLLWMPIFVAWLVKSVMLRYGGPRSYQNALPFFYGLILGQFIPGSLLNIWGIVTGMPTYQFWQ
jgi:hypothetical protein